jgi:hypothetical protein
VPQNCTPLDHAEEIPSRRATTRATGRDLVVPREPVTRPIRIREARVTEPQLA